MMNFLAHLSQILQHIDAASTIRKILLLELTRPLPSASIVAKATITTVLCCSDDTQGDTLPTA